MKYLFIILLFACSQPNRKYENIFSVDSTGRLSGPATDPGAFTGLKYYRIRVATDSGTLGYEQDGTITITGDTMSVIRSILGTIDQKSKWYTELYKENQELRRLIEGLIKQQNEIQHTRFTTDL